MIDLDHFRERGFVRLDGALDTELVERWRAESFSRLRSSTPEVLHDSVPQWTPGLFADLDPDRPATWRARRATLSGTARAALTDAAPRVRHAIDALLGPGRLHTKSITNYLIVSFPTRGWQRAWQSIRPNRGNRSYHLDDPGDSMSLDGWRNAVLLFALFSDIAPGSGGTQLACDSPPRVARALAHGGANFVTDELAASLAAKCSDIEELAGTAGDVLVAHPFLLHSAAKNTGSHVRILANPMLRANGPLAFRPGTAARSPLEEITQSWVR